MKLWREAFQRTVPVMCGYLVVGVAFGLLLEDAGYGVLWAFLISCVVYAGSMQFVLVSFLTGSLSFLSMALTTLAVNCRHLFYGLSFLDEFQQMGAKKPYMIFSLTDETYSLLCSMKGEERPDKAKLSFLMSLFDQSYWVAGSVLGSLAGNLIPFDLTGIDFAMTALFVVIFLEQWLSNGGRRSALIGLGCGVASLLLLGPDGFLLPALVSSVALLLITGGKGAGDSSKGKEETA